MTTNQPKINEIVNYLKNFDNDQLNSLKKEFPEYEKFLKPGIILGDENEGTENEEYKFRLAVAEKGLRVIFMDSEKLYIKLKPKLKSINNVDLTSQIISLIGGATMLTLIEKDLGAAYNWIKYIAPGAIVISSLLSLFAKNRLESTLGGEDNLFKLTNTIIQYNAEAKALLAEIEVSKTFFAIEKAKGIIESANKLAKEMEVVINKTI